MELKITRLASDEPGYVIESAEGVALGMEASELKTWMLDIGMGDSTVAAVLDMSPNETMSFVFILGKRVAKRKVA